MAHFPSPLPPAEPAAVLTRLISIIRASPTAIRSSATSSIACARRSLVPLDRLRR
jgi:hypothetical protein